MIPQQSQFTLKQAQSKVNEQPAHKNDFDYSKQSSGVTVINVEVGNIEDDISELQTNGAVTEDAIGVELEIISDTRASHHLTNDKSVLSDFRSLKNPIPLKLATDGCKNAITGIGTLSLHGKNGMNISFKGVMFCEQAGSTLISPAALRQAKLIIDYDSHANTFLFKSAEGTTLLKSPMDTNWMCWTLPQPIKVDPDISSISYPSHFCSSNSFLNHSVKNIPSIYTSSPSSISLSYNPSPEFLFKFPMSKHDFSWHASDLSKDEIGLICWHHLFGHAGLQHICKMIKLNLGIGPPSTIPKGDIKYPVCMIAKGTRTNLLSPTYRPVYTLDIIACHLMGPF